MCLATRVGLLRHHLGQIVTDSRQTLSFRYRLLTTLTGIAQMLLQYGYGLCLIQIKNQLSGVNG